MQGGIMRKDTTICFRTSEEVKNSFEKIAKEERRSLSRIIENTLFECVKRAGHTRSRKDNRRHTRREVSLPAFVSKVNSDTPQPGIILDLSLSGLRLSVPSDWGMDITEDTKSLKILFTLPKENRPLSLTCAPCRTREENGELEVGAAFCDCDLPNYQRLQNYLMQ
jgi:hypothetical protein